MIPDWIAKIILVVMVAFMVLGMWHLVGWMMGIIKIGGVDSLRLVLAM
jgi:hypothetical protein